MFCEVQSIELSSFFEGELLFLFSVEVSSFRVFDLGTPDAKEEDAVEDAELQADIEFSSSGLGSGVEVGVLFSDRFGLVVFSLFSPIFSGFEGYNNIFW